MSEVKATFLIKIIKKHTQTNRDGEWLPGASSRDPITSVLTVSPLQCEAKQWLCASLTGRSFDRQSSIVYHQLCQSSVVYHQLCQSSVVCYQLCQSSVVCYQLCQSSVVAISYVSPLLSTVSYVSPLLSTISYVSLL